MKPLISIIIPMYNAEKYIEKCINSLIKQKYRNIEILIVDDGSTDNSLLICERLKKQDSRIILIHQEKEGVSVARNMGLKKARGNYVLFVDSDDYVYDNYVEDLWSALTITNADVAISCYTKDDKYFVVQDNNMQIHKMGVQEALINMLLSKDYDSSVCCKLFKKAMIKGVGFREDLVIAEDLCFFYHLILNSKNIVFINKIGYCYVQHEHGTIQQFSSKKMESLYVFEELIDSCNNQSVKEAIISKYISTCFHFLLLDCNKNVCLEDLKKIIIKYRKYAVKGHYITKKVKIASVLSYISFSLVKIIFMMNRGIAK